MGGESKNVRVFDGVCVHHTIAAGRDAAIRLAEAEGRPLAVIRVKYSRDHRRHGGEEYAVRYRRTRGRWSLYSAIQVAGRPAEKPDFSVP